MTSSSRLLASLALGFALFGAASLQPSNAFAKKVDPSGDPVSDPEHAQASGKETDNVLTKTVTIDGSVGGHFNVQSWVLTVPAGAFRGKAAITMTVSGTVNQNVALSCSPATLMPFLRPVTLEYTKCRTGEDIGNESIYTWDAALWAWVPAPNQTGDVTAGTLKSLLPNMATFRIRGGRAGW